MSGIKGMNIGNTHGFKKGIPSLMKGRTKASGNFPKGCGFQVGHKSYSYKGMNKGQVAWNEGTAILVECKCLTCGNIFKIRKHQVNRGRGKYCSKECSAKRERIKIRETKQCLQCNKSFEIRLCEKSKKFCSRVCLNQYKTGKKIAKFTEEHKRKIGEGNKIAPHPRGKDHPHWKGGITPYYSLLRCLDEYKKWRMDCLKRDWFRCQECFTKKNLEVHHLVSFQKLLNNFLQKYNMFSPIDDRETLIKLSTTYEPFWDISNGQTLCETHHKSLRRKYETVV
jgi:hypothetical protein